MRQGKLSWPKTRVPWEIKVVVWRRWALGDTKAQTVAFFELNIEEYPKAPLHVDTIRKVRDELTVLPIELLDKLLRDMPELGSLIKQQ